MMVAYLIGKEDESEITMEKIKMKNLTLSVNPELYKAFYPEEFSDTPTSPKVEDNIIVPRSEQDLKKIYEKFQNDGLITGLESSGINIPRESFDLKKTYQKLKEGLDSEQNVDSMLREALQNQPNNDEISVKF